MNSEASSVLERPAITSFSVEKAAHDVGDLTRPNNVKPEAFIVGLAWAFASAVFLLVVVGLVLVVAGYAGSIFSQDVHPKAPPPSSWPRK